MIAAKGDNRRLHTAAMSLYNLKIGFFMIKIIIIKRNVAILLLNKFGMTRLTFLINRKWATLAVSS